MNKQEIEKKLRLLLRSVYLKGQMDKTTDLSWEDKIIEDIIALLQAGDNIGKCKVCDNVLQKEGCPVCHEPVCHEKEQARRGINKINICRTIYEMLQYLPNGIEGEKDIEAIADAILALSHPPSPCREELLKQYQIWHSDDYKTIKRYREAIENMLHWKKLADTTPEMLLSSHHAKSGECEEIMRQYELGFKKLQTALEAGKEER